MKPLRSAKPTAERGHEVPAPHVHQRVLQETEHRPVELRDQRREVFPGVEVGISAGERGGELLDHCELRFGDARERRAQETCQPEDGLVVDEAGTRQGGEPLHDLDVELRERGDVLWDLGEAHRTPPLHRPFVIDPRQPGDVFAPVSRHAEPGCAV
ncbi:MAG: hypothetical protein ACXW1S_06380 [Acidimicrobiia bacterium]